MLLRFYRHMILFILLTGTTVFSFGQTCKIGDVLINRNDRSRGVVFWVNPERTGGWMIAMKSMPQAPLAAIQPSGILPSPSYIPVKDTAGYSNTIKLRNMCKTGDYNILQVDIEHGWYIPACGQLWHLFTVIDIINPVLAAHGGDTFSTDWIDLTAFVSSSPAETYSKIYYLDFLFQHSMGDLRINGTKNTFQRAIRTFTMSDILIDTTLTYQWNTGGTTPQISDKPMTTTTYTVKATTTDGCPAEASGQVFVTNTPQMEIYDTIRRGETYTKHGFRESEPGTYPKTIDNGNGCSTEIILHLYVQEPLSPTVFNETICEGQIYTQHNFTAWENGSYTQQWTSADGRDSTVILNLTVHPVYNQTFEATICQGERYTQNGFDENEAGTYVQPFTSQQGCDSTITLTLSVLPQYLFTDEQTLCYGETYEFCGKIINESGIYYDSLKTMTGCDSVYQLILNIKPEITKNIEATICQGERYTLNGFDKDEAGTYVQHFTSQQGCDSTVTLTLNVLPNYLFTDEQTLCYGETYEFCGRTINESGIYYDSLKTMTGCDSIYQLILNIKPEITKNIEATICQGERYTQNGFDIDEAGIYVQHFTSQQGCDSTVTLTLSVLPQYLFTDEQTLCYGETYEFRGRTISESGIYYDSLKTVTGCDSVYQLTLNIKPEIAKNIQATICQGERYTQNGFDKDEAGTYVQHFTSQQGCDSTVTLTLNVLPHYLFTDEQTLCYGETYEFRGKTISESGIYYDSLKTVTGCDSVYQLTLNIKPEIAKNIQATICQGERYTLNGFDENETGIYVQHFTSRQGCDSTVTLTLNVTAPPEGKIQAALEDCTDHTYLFRFISNGADHLSDYFWDFGNGETSDEISPRYSFPDSGQYTIRLTLHPEQLCNTTFTYPLNVPYYPENLSIYTDPAFVSKEYPEIIFWTDPIPGISYRWELGDGNTATGDRISHFYDFSSLDAYPIRLTATNSENCITEQNALLPNKQVFVIPNTFSPNGDGINDVFMPGYRMKIMDRNGLVVYNGNEGWDGNYKGGKASEDVYFYILYLKTDRSSKEITGYIHLTR